MGRNWVSFFVLGVTIIGGLLIGALWSSIRGGGQSAVLSSDSTTTTTFAAPPRIPDQNLSPDLSPSAVVIQTRGLDQFKLSLEAPYGAANPSPLLIRNQGQRTVIAYRIIYRGRRKDGSTRERFLTRIDLKAAMPKEPAGATAIHPGQIVFDGFGQDAVKLSEGFDQIPPALDPALQKEALSTHFPDFKSYESMEIVFQGVMLEDGKSYGENTAVFRQFLEDFFTEYNTRSGGRNDLKEVPSED